MRRPVAHLLLALILIFQGVVAVAAPVLAHDEAQHHCAGHEMQQKDCPCCPDGVVAGGCTVQCSVSQASFMMSMPMRVETVVTTAAFVDRLIDDPHYTPLIPPPIR